MGASARAVRITEPVVRNAANVQVSAAYGRLYVSGPHALLLLRLPGAFEDVRRMRGVVQLSLTLESLRAIRTTLRVSREQMARFCTRDVLEWARKAAASEKRVAEVHRLIDSGHRIEFDWLDTREHTSAPDSEDESKVEYILNNRRVYRYREPFEHQKVIATAAAMLDGLAVIGEMGVAKTRAVTEAIQYLLDRDEGRFKFVFVFCPKGVMRTWEAEFAQWAPGVRIERLTGSIANRIRRLQEVRDMPEPLLSVLPEVFITNYDALHDMKVPLAAFMDQFASGMVLDEMHVVKNPQAQVTKAALHVARHAAWRLGQTGTPVTNGIQDVWSQWYMIDYGTTFGSNFVQFRREFTTTNEYTNEVSPLDGAPTEIGLRMRRRGLRYRKADCMDLPPKLYEVEEVEMQPQQGRAYAEMESQLIAWLRSLDSPEPGDAEDDVDDTPHGVVTAANQLVAILRLSQITSGFAPMENGQTHFFEPNPKLDAVERIVRENVRDQQIIVWAQYTNDINMILARLADLQPVRIDGTQQGPKGERDRAEAERLFQSGERRVLVGNPSAGGVGINLQRASMAIYYSMGYSLTDRVQSEDRCHRAGSEVHNHVTYIDLVCSGTIDGVVRAAVLGKKRLAETVTDLRGHLGV